MGIIWREEKAANRGEWIGTHQIVFTRKPAQGDHVGSRLHSYQSKGCVRSWWHSFHMPGPLPMIQAIWETLFLLKLCFIEILFGVSLSVTSPLSCLRAKIVKLSTASPFEFVLLTSSPVVVSKSGWPIPAPDQLSLGFYKVENKLLFIFWPPLSRLLFARFQFVFMLLYSRKRKAFGSAWRWFHFETKPHSLWGFLSGYHDRGQKSCEVVPKGINLNFI